MKSLGQHDRQAVSVHQLFNHYQVFLKTKEYVEEGFEITQQSGYVDIYGELSPSGWKKTCYYFPKNVTWVRDASSLSLQQ